MKVKLVLGIISILFLSLTSCNSNELDGKWDDNIKLSEKEIAISAEANQIEISTEGTWWWISEIGLDDDWSYDINEIDTTKDDFLIVKSEFTIERKNTNEIYISVTKNQSEHERTLIISLQSGNYFDGIRIIQAGN